MADNSTSPRQRRYPTELREQAVRLVDQASAEGERHDAITRVASQLVGMITSSGPTVIIRTGPTPDR